MKKQKNIVVSKMATSMMLSRFCLGSMMLGVGGFGVWRHAKKHALDHEQQKSSPTDRDWQIGDADGQGREVRDRIVPGHGNQSFAVYDHEQGHRSYQEFGQ